MTMPIGVQRGRSAGAPAARPPAVPTLEALEPRVLLSGDSILTELISLTAAGAQGNGESYSPAISADGCPETRTA